MKWISIKDSLPDGELAEVYNLVFSPTTYPYQQLGFYLLSEIWVNNNDETIQDVTHWMSLPPPPQVDE